MTITVSEEPRNRVLFTKEVVDFLDKFLKDTDIAIINQLERLLF